MNIIDIETFGKNSITPYCCSIIYKNKTFTYYGLSCIEKILIWIFDNCLTNSIFFAHNLTFDGLLILNNLPNDIHISDYGTSIKNGNIYSLAIVKNFKRIFFRCSAKILPLSLDTIAKKLLLPNKIDLDHNLINEKNFLDNNIKNKIIKYCERDVLIVHRFMTKIFFSLKEILPNWWISCYSISGIAFKIYIKNFNNLNINLNLDIDSDRLIRPAYYGGRCEVFGNPYAKDYIFHFDFTSMYSNRLKEKFPYGDFKKKYPTEIKEIGFYYVTVESNLNLPILPYRSPDNGKLLFPNGKFNGLFWYEELILFKENGGKIVKIFWALIFEKEDYVFKDFAETCLKSRNNTLIDNIIWKLIPNSFIGRLGLKDRYEKTLILDNGSYNPLEYNVISDKQINDKWLVKVKTCIDNININSNVIYPAIVTSKARIVWWKSAKCVEDNGGRLLYCDTDSLFVSFRKNIIGSTHGDIFWDPKKEDTVINNACFATNKVYCIQIKDKTITKIKGIPNKKITLDFSEFSKLFYEKRKKNISFEFFSKKNFKIKIEDMWKEINFGGYDKRIFIKKKKETKPLYIENTLYNENTKIN